MNDHIAYCGQDCETCEARLATVNDDNELKKLDETFAYYADKGCDVKKLGDYTDEGNTI